MIVLRPDIVIQYVFRLTVELAPLQMIINLGNYWPMRCQEMTFSDWSIDVGTYFKAFDLSRSN